MAGSRTPKPKRAEAGQGQSLAQPLDLDLGLTPFFAKAPLRLPLAVAFSGGADSTALLHAAVAQWPGQVHAIHVHHGLQAAADDFALHCQTVCDVLGTPLHMLRVNAQAEPGQSPEDAARKARYAALAQAANAASLHDVLLGQHADDQVETIVLALSRGAGLPGLSAMPARFERYGVRFHRPLLGLSAADLKQALHERLIPFIEDPSNRDERYTRNRIRARLMPALAEVFPQFRQTFARSASHAAEAQRVLDDIAAQDFIEVGSPPAIRKLQALSVPRQANVLRYWLATCHGVRPSAAQLSELQAQIAACTTRGHQLRLKVATGHVLRVGWQLQWMGSI
jgi:tRNA(Ile)-lysidine synthase